MRSFFLRFTATLLASAFLFSGCATVFGKSSYQVSINSIPMGADITITDRKGDQVFTGKTPTIATLKSGAGYFKKAQYLVKIASPGYADQTAPIEFNLNGWYFGNILIGGVIGFLIVDPLTGAMYKLKTPTVNLTLSKATVSETPALKILNVNDLTPEMRKQLVRIN